MASRHFKVAVTENGCRYLCQDGVPLFDLGKNQNVLPEEARRIKEAVVTFEECRVFEIIRWRRVNFSYSFI